MPALTPYQQFLLTDFWKEKSESCKRRAGYRCQDCGGLKFLHAHHTVYRFPWTDVRDEDLRCLCDKCHRKAHGIEEPKAKIVVTRWPKGRPKKRKKHRPIPPVKHHINVMGHKFIY